VRHGAKKTGKRPKGKREAGPTGPQKTGATFRANNLQHEKKKRVKKGYSDGATENQTGEKGGGPKCQEHHLSWESKVQRTSGGKKVQDGKI